MNKNFFHGFASFVKRNAVPFLAGGVLFLVAYIHFILGGPSPNPSAPDEVQRFRKPLAFRRGQGTWYDTADFRKFIDTFGNRIKYADIHGIPCQIHDAAKYKWVIGFYWKRVKDPVDHKVKYSYCIVPTLAELQQNGEWVIIDYFEDARKPRGEQHYNHAHDASITQRPTTTEPGINPYDNGHLWP